MVTKQNFKNIMKKAIICSLSTLSVLSLSNCTKGPGTNYIDDAIAIVYQDEKPYLINANKDTYALDYYDEVEDIFNDYIAIKKDGKYGFIDRTGKLTVQPSYDKVYPMYEEKAVVIKEGVYQIINNTGKTIYTFEDGLTSESYFSNNLLVVSKDDKYGYLKFNEKTNEFTKSEIIFDFAKAFKDEYAVVGIKPSEIIYKVDEEGNITSEIEEIRIQDNIKYNYIDTEFNLLFNNYDFDYADNFYNGYAVVGYIDEIYAPGVDSGISGQAPSKSYTTEGLVYKYINPYGKTLHYDHKYQFSVIVNGTLNITNKTYTDEIYMPFAQSFQSDLTFVAKYRYSTVETHLKEYILVNNYGKMNYTDAVYDQTGYKFGHDSGHQDADDFQCQSPGLFTVGTVQKIGDTYAFVAGHTLTSPSWKVYYLKYDFDRKYYAFETVIWDVIKTNKNDDGSQTETVPQWGIDYKYNYLKNTSSNVLLKFAIENPYEMTDLGYSKYYSDEILVNTVRLSKSNKYGLAAYTTNSVYLEDYLDYTTTLTASFVLDPIYDKIIY